jgi:GH15 family glucan-1,4-alpha-glucosidase
MVTRIEDYGLIGDCTTAALVGRDGSIDWLCWPRFDSDACFAALLGTPDHGRWLITPHDAVDKITRRYRPNTLVLETCFECAHGAVTLVDFMALRAQGSNLIRLVVGQRGRVRMHTEFIVRFGYGAAVPWVSRIDEHTLRAVAGPDMLLMRTPAHLRGENMKTVGDFTIAEGATVPFVLSYSASHLPSPPALDALDQLRATEQYWTQWAGMTQIRCPWNEAVMRSLITLKALTYAPTGGVVAAPTTSLPEQFGGERNWDYRFCWLRDATLTLLALMNAGYYEEAHAWREWLLRAAAGSPHQLQIMYGIAGERRLTEWQVPWLPGYANSQPVRIGNAAHNQAQLDVYGELMDALHHARQGGLAATESGWALQIEVLKHLETVWQEPDEGIWEVRSGREHFTYSKVMAWVAFDRAIKSADMFNLAGPIDHWRRIRERIHDDVCRHGFDAGLNSFVRSYGSRVLDASLLLLPAVGFLPVQDSRIRGTVEAIERRLVVDGLVMRYDTASAQDGLPPGEGAFLPCSFWLVDVYAMLGRRDEAHHLFARLVSLCNDVGLLSEEYDPRTARLAGNFPQAFSHLALVNSACNLGHVVKPVHQRGEKHVTVPG